MESEINRATAPYLPPSPSLAVADVLCLKRAIAATTSSRSSEPLLCLSAVARRASCAVLAVGPGQWAARGKAKSVSAREKIYAENCDGELIDKVTVRRRCL